MGRSHTSLHRPESAFKQVGYLLVLAGAGGVVMLAGLVLVVVILDLVQG